MSQSGPDGGAETLDVRIQRITDLINDMPDLVRRLRQQSVALAAVRNKLVRAVRAGRLKPHKRDKLSYVPFDLVEGLTINLDGHLGVDWNASMEMHDELRKEQHQSVKVWFKTADVRNAVSPEGDLEDLPKNARTTGISDAVRLSDELTVVAGSEAVRTARQKRPVSAAALQKWYAKRCNYWPSHRKHPSQDDDLTDARQQFPEHNVTRPAIRAVRKRLAPKAWTDHGRRKLAPQ
jgi:hypothetical protein